MKPYELKNYYNMKGNCLQGTTKKIKILQSISLKLGS